MAKIFISYARADSEVAAKLARSLSTLGFDLWWDAELYAGDDFHSVIREEIGKAQAVVVIWSEAAVRSAWVRGEAEEAFDQGKLISTHIGRFDKRRLPINFLSLHCEHVENVARVVEAIQRKGVSPSNFVLDGDDERKSVMDRASAGELEAWLELEPEIAEFSDRADAHGQYLIGNFFLNAVGPAHSASQAVRYYTLASDQGHSGAQAALGRMYWEGNGIEKDDSKAERFLRKAAEAGDSNALCLLGSLFLIGSGVPKDRETAILMLKKASAQGNYRAATILGFAFENGTGVPKDVGEALLLFQWAADCGDVQAQLRLGEIYENGLGVPAHRAKALMWYEKAAMQGDHAALGSVRRLNACS